MTRLTNAARIVWLILREVFDEAAYTRFLQQNQMSSSSRAYRLFLRERESTVAQRVRCC